MWNYVCFTSKKLSQIFRLFILSRILSIEANKEASFSIGNT